MKIAQSLRVVDRLLDKEEEQFAELIQATDELVEHLLYVEQTLDEQENQRFSSDEIEAWNTLHVEEKQ